MCLVCPSESSRIFFMAPNQATPEEIGERVRRLREVRGISRDELARRSGLSKTTILRFERGLPTRRNTLNEIAVALRYPSIYLMLSEEDYERPYHVHRRGADVWHALGPLKKRSSDHPADASDPDERNRLGSLGYYDSFFQPITCLLRDANFGAGICEIYANSSDRAVHPGLEFAYMLNGSAIVTIGADEVLVNEGEAIIFWADEPHDYRPAAPVGRHEQPPRCLMVVLEGPERPR